MFASKQRPFALTLLISVVVALALVSAANADSVQRRDHTGLNRILKKRSPQGPGGVLSGPLAAAGADDPAEGGTQESASAPAPPASASASSPAAPSSPSAPAQPSASAPPAASSVPPASESAASNPAQPSASDTPPASQSGGAASDTPPPPADPTPKPDPNPAPVDQPPTSVSKGNRGGTTILHYETAKPSPDADAEKSGASSSAGKTTAVVFAAIIGAVAGVTVIWTIFRRWKLSRSSKFDARMNPIDWEPSAAADDTRRHSNASSFHSSGHGHGYGSTSNHGHGVPDHDFTAGPTHLAPVGGYADLARGPSPSPSMHELHRGTNVAYPQPGYGAQDYYDTGRRY